jgi:putative hydrolase of the HAD superfamily
VKPAWIVLDIGGVLVEVDADRRLEEWTHGRLKAREFWPLWLSSPAVKRFETGQTDGLAFAQEAVTEFGLDMEPEAFLLDFQDWLVGPYPGALSLLDRLRPLVPLACFSNSSCVHWPMLDAMLDCSTRFQHTFATHRLGVLKPQPEAFAKVLATLAVPASQVWFFDDNLVNVEAARHAGFQSWQVKGALELTRLLESLLPEMQNAS